MFVTALWEKVQGSRGRAREMRNEACLSSAWEWVTAGGQLGRQDEKGGRRARQSFAGTDKKPENRTGTIYVADAAGCSQWVEAAKKDVHAAENKAGMKEN